MSERRGPSDEPEGRLRQRMRRYGAPRWIAEPQWTRPPLEPPPESPARPPGDGTSLRVLTLNVAHGRKLATHQALLSPATLRRNLSEVAEVIEGSRADVVALQEADGPSAWSGNFDHVETLAELTGRDHFFRGEHNPFALGRANLASGTALLGGLPLRRTGSHRFGINWRDTKGFVVGAVELAGVEVDIVSVHLEPFMPAVRRQQIRQLTEQLADRDRPLVVLGDFNCSWCEEARAFQPLVRHLGLSAWQPYHRAPTYPSRRPWRRLDWILVSGELEFASYRTLPNPVSDHLGVMAEVRLKRAARRAGERDEPADAGSAA